MNDFSIRAFFTFSVAVVLYFRLFHSIVPSDDRDGAYGGDFFVCSLVSECF